jgi:hypothetical protein
LPTLSVIPCIVVSGRPQKRSAKEAKEATS